MNPMTQYPIDGDPARGMGYGLLISAVCWLAIYGGAIGLVALTRWLTS